MRDRYETEFGTDMEEMFPEFGNIGNATFQVTDACNLACKYCYQINKGHKVMSFDVAKKFVDLLLTTENNNYFNPSTYGGIILEFIGGEPFLQVDLIDQIIDYFMLKTMELNHPWKDRFRVSICSNGVLYFSDKVQKFIKKHDRHLSLSITVDGFKEMHDACRVFPDGSPSYELAIAADKDLLKKNGYGGTKITVAPGNVEYIFQATKNMVEIGHKVININCVYEDGWTLQHAKILYKQLKQVADYFLSFNDPGDYYYRFFDKDIYRPMTEDENDNYCGGNGKMIACNPDGYVYPCLRYMESSLGCSQKPLIIGDVFNGIAVTDEQNKLINDMKAITRRSQSTDECFYCSVASGCSWCSAFNYQTYGTVDKRTTFHCLMHKATSLANTYYWNKRFILEKSKERLPVYCDFQTAIDIIGKDEYEMLLNLSE